MRKKPQAINYGVRAWPSRSDEFGIKVLRNFATVTWAIPLSQLGQKLGLLFRPYQTMVLNQKLVFTSTSPNKTRFSPFKKSFLMNFVQWADPFMFSSPVGVSAMRKWQWIKKDVPKVHPSGSKRFVLQRQWTKKKRKERNRAGCFLKKWYSAIVIRK